MDVRVGSVKDKTFHLLMSRAHGAGVITNNKPLEACLTGALYHRYETESDS
jgi:hypothetical protein